MFTSGVIFVYDKSREAQGPNCWQADLLIELSGLYFSCARHLILTVLLSTQVCT